MSRPNLSFSGTGDRVKGVVPYSQAPVHHSPTWLDAVLSLFNFLVTSLDFLSGTLINFRFYLPSSSGEVID